MFKFGKFKSTFNVYNGTTKGGHQEQISYGTSSLSGAYRVNKNEFSMYGNYSESQGKVKDAALVPHPIPSQQISKSNRQIKSSRDLVNNKNPPAPIPQAPSGVTRDVVNNKNPPAPIPQAPSGITRDVVNNKNPPAPIPQVPSGISRDVVNKKNPQAPIPQAPSGVSRDVVKNKNPPAPIPQAPSGVSPNPQGASEPRRNSKGPSADPNIGKQQLDAYKRVEKKRLEEQKKTEKKRLEEQKKMEKKRLEEQKKSQKLALQEQAKQEKLRKEREKKEAEQLKGKKNKKQAPQRPLVNPLAQSSSQATSNPTAQPSAVPYSTNTLNSSISKTSGPPPYSQVPQPERKENETNSNVQFSKPIEADSWDLVSQHRHNVIINKHANPTQPVKGQTTMDLNFTLGEGKSDA